MIEVTIGVSLEEGATNKYQYEARATSTELTVKSSVQENHIGYAGEAIAQCLKRLEVPELYDIQDAAVIARALNQVVLDLMNRYRLTADEIAACTNVVEDIPF